MNDEDTAFHAGAVFKPNFFSNDATIGIEQEHFDPEGRRKNEDWPDVQIEKVAQLTTFLLQQHGLNSPADIKTHAEIARPLHRKQDPFDYPFPKFHRQIEENQRFVWKAEES